MPLSTATAAVALALAAAGGTASMLGEAGADACSAGSSGAIFDDDTGEALNECAVQLVKRATGTVDTGGAARSSGGGAAARAEGLGGGVGRQPPSVVEIDEGTWKYVSIDLSRNGGGGAADRTRLVRSYSGSRYHAHTFQRAMEALEGWQGRVVGGGRIALDSRAKTISIYGYSKTFGRAPGCNEHSAQLIQQAYPSFKVTWSDKGY